MINKIGEVDSSVLLKEYLKLESKIFWQNNMDNEFNVGLYRYDQKIYFGQNKTHKESAWAYCSADNTSYVETVFESIKENFNLKRIRFMWLKYNSCYEFHLDPFENIHIPIITNQECYFLFKNGYLEHLKTGSVYLVNTKLEHTVINGGASWRLHLVGNT